MSMPGCEARCGVSGVRRVRGLSMLCVVRHSSHRGREPSACGVPQSVAKDCSQNLRGCDGHACAAFARHVCKYARVHVNSAMCTWAMARAAAQHGCAGADSGKNPAELHKDNPGCSGSQRQDANQTASNEEGGGAGARRLLHLPPARHVKRQRRAAARPILAAAAPALCSGCPRERFALQQPSAYAPTHSARRRDALVSTQDTSTPLILSTDQQAAATESQRCMKQHCAQTRPLGAVGAERL